MTIIRHWKTVNMQMRRYVKLNIGRPMLCMFPISINYAITGYVLCNGFAWPSVSMESLESLNKVCHICHTIQIDIGGGVLIGKIGCIITGFA